MGNFAWIGWVIAFASLVAGFVYFRSNRKVKRIDWWVDSDQSLINLRTNEFAEPILVSVGDHSVRNPRLVQVTIKNTGTVGLTTKNMHQEFNVMCSGGAEIIIVTISRFSAAQKAGEKLPVMYLKGHRGVNVPSTLLNPGDRLTCQLLVDGLSGEVTVHGEAEDFAIRGLPNREYVEVQPSTKAEYSKSILITVGLVAALLATATIVNQLI